MKDTIYPPTSDLSVTMANGYHNYNKSLTRKKKVHSNKKQVNKDFPDKKSSGSLHAVANEPQSQAMKPKKEKTPPPPEYYAAA